MATVGEIVDNRAGSEAAAVKRVEALDDREAAIQTELNQAREALVLGLTAVIGDDISEERKEELDAAIPELASDVISGIFRAVQLEITKPSHVAEEAHGAYLAGRSKSRDGRMKTDIAGQVSGMFSGNRSSR